jgi:hypothetical protein
MRLRSGRVSFEVPKGFDVLTDGSPVHESREAWGKDRKPGVSVTLVRKAEFGEPVEYSPLESGELVPEAFPASIALTALSFGGGEGPLDHLRRTAEVLRPHLPGFEIVLLKESRVGRSEAALAAFRFHTQLSIEQIQMAWVLGEEPVKAIMTVSAVQADEGLEVLKAFAESVVLHS